MLGLPRYTSSVMQRHSKTSFPHYNEFANAYSTFSTDEVHKVAQAHVETFQKVEISTWKNSKYVHRIKILDL